MQIDIVSLVLTDMRWYEADGFLWCDSLKTNGRFPDQINVASHWTGKVVRFVKDYARNEANEWYDGEQCDYRPVDPSGNVVRLSVCNTSR